MEIETILPGTPEMFQDSNPVIDHLIELRTRLLTQGDFEAVIEELKWYQGLRDSAESIDNDDRLVWKELHQRYQDLSDDQIGELIHKLEESENGDYINQ